MTPSLTKERGTKGHKVGEWRGEVMEQKEVPFSDLRRMVQLLISPDGLEQ